MITDGTAECLTAAGSLVRFYFSKKSDGMRETRKFPGPYLTIETACGAVFIFVLESALDISMAQRAGNDPAGPAGVSSAVNPVQPYLSCGGAYSEFDRF